MGLFPHHRNKYDESATLTRLGQKTILLAFSIVGQEKFIKNRFSRLKTIWLLGIL